MASADTDYSSTYTASNNGVPYESSCAFRFAGNTSFNSPISIGENVNSAYHMLEGCSSFGQDVYIRGGRRKSNSVLGSFNASGLFKSCNNSKRKNIWFNNILNNCFNNTGAVSSITNTAITWTAMTNGFYNTAYNIYCYYNYSG